MHQNLEQRKKKQYSNKKTFNQNKIFNNKKKKKKKKKKKNKQYVYLFCCFFKKQSLLKEVEKNLYKEKQENIRLSIKRTIKILEKTVCVKPSSFLSFTVL